MNALVGSIMQEIERGKEKERERVKQRELRRDRKSTGETEIVEERKSAKRVKNGD